MVPRKAMMSLVALWAWLPLASMGGCDRDEPLPKLAELPSFELTDQDGEPFRSSDLDDKVWIADFIFTSCPTYCPVLTEKMIAIREELSEQHGQVGYLSVSVDPEHDTPAVLRDYAREHGATYDDWVFLTGSTSEVTDVVVEGFKAPMGKPRPRQEADVYTILHARHFVLVDRRRRIRGYYRTDSEPLERLVRDAKRLADR